MSMSVLTKNHHNINAPIIPGSKQTSLSILGARIEGKTYSGCSLGCRDNQCWTFALLGRFLWWGSNIADCAFACSPGKKCQLAPCIRWLCVPTDSIDSKLSFAGTSHWCEPLISSIGNTAGPNMRSYDGLLFCICNSARCFWNIDTALSHFTTTLPRFWATLC